MTMSVARADRLKFNLLKVDDPVRASVSTGVLGISAPSVLSESIPVFELSWIRRLTRPAVDVRRVYVVDAQDDFEQLLVYGERRSIAASTGQDDDNILLNEFYGIATAQAFQETYIGPGDVESPPLAERVGERDLTMLVDAWKRASSRDAGVTAVAIGERARRWLVAEILDKEKVHTVYAETGASADRLTLKAWPRGSQCPAGIPIDVLTSTGLRDPQGGNCLRPTLRPFAEEDLVKSLESRVTKAVGTRPRDPLLTPLAVADRVFQADFAARRRLQRDLARWGFAGGACASRLVARVPVRACIVRVEHPGAPARLAEIWRDLEPSVLFKVEMLDERVTLAEWAYGGRYTSQAVATFANRSEAAFVVAGPASPRYAESALRPILERLTSLVGVEE
jgi:hypothetical protein